MLRGEGDDVHVMFLRWAKRWCVARHNSRSGRPVSRGIGLPTLGPAAEELGLGTDHARILVREIPDVPFEPAVRAAAHPPQDDAHRCSAVAMLQISDQRIQLVKTLAVDALDNV